MLEKPPITISGLRPEQAARRLEALRAAGDRRGFSRLADRVARAWSPLAMYWWLPQLSRGERAALAAAEPELRLRPGFDSGGPALHICTPAGAEHFLRLSRATRAALVELSFSAAVGRRAVVACLLAGDLQKVRSLRLEANNLRPRQALVWRGDENLINLRVSGDDRLFEALGELPALEVLKLRTNRLGSAGAIALSALSGLKRLDLRGNRVGNQGAAALATLPALTHLDLSFNEVRAEGARALAGAPALTHLDLSGNPVGDAGAAALGALVPLEQLRLVAAGLGPAALPALGGLVGLTHLELGRNPLGEGTLDALAELPALTHLDLRRVGLGEAGARALGRLAGLTALSLDGNPLGDSGAEPLAALRGLRSLSVSRCGLGPRGAAALAGLRLSELRLDAGAADPRVGAAALGLLTEALTVASLNGQDMGDTGARALGRCTGLVRLYLSRNRVGDAGAAALAGLPALEVLHLDHNRVGPSGAAALAGLPVLTHLSLDDNPLGPGGGEALAELSAPVRLHLRRTGVSGRELERLREALPGCTILPRAAPGSAK